MQIETGQYLGKIPYAKVGQSQNPLLVISGGQSFMMRGDLARMEKDARRLIRILGEDHGFVLVGYDPNPSGVSIDGIASDIAEIILRHFSGKADLIGISYGAVIAARLAARCPDTIGKLVLLAGAHDFSRDGKARLDKQVQLIRSGEYKMLIREFAAVFRSPLLNLLLRLRIALSGSRLAQKLGRSDVILRYLEAMTSDAFPVCKLAAISAETLIIGGSKDQFFQETMLEASRAIPDARLVMFEGETHMVPIERAKDVRFCMRQFVL